MWAQLHPTQSWRFRLAAQDLRLAGAETQVRILQASPALRGTPLRSRNGAGSPGQCERPAPHGRKRRRSTTADSGAVRIKHAVCGFESRSVHQPGEDCSLPTLLRTINKLPGIFGRMDHAGSIPALPTSRVNDMGYLVVYPISTNFPTPAARAARSLAATPIRAGACRHPPETFIIERFQHDNRASCLHNDFNCLRNDFRNFCSVWRCRINSCKIRSHANLRIHRGLRVLRRMVVLACVVCNQQSIKR